MKLLFLAVAIFLSSLCHSQKNRIENNIDSLLIVISGQYNYRYWNGDDDHSFHDFRIDTLSGKLITYSYKRWTADTITVTYYFIENFLAKINVINSTNKSSRVLQELYYKEDKLLVRRGANTVLGKSLLGTKGLFYKVSPSYVKRQLKFIYYNFTYFTSPLKRYKGKMPILLADAIQRIDGSNP